MVIGQDKVALPMVVRLFVVRARYSKTTTFNFESGAILLKSDLLKVYNSLQCRSAIAVWR
jgi:hypothetical protein